MLEYFFAWICLIYKTFFDSRSFSEIKVSLENLNQNYDRTKWHITKHKPPTNFIFFIFSNLLGKKIFDEITNLTSIIEKLRGGREYIDSWFLTFVHSSPPWSQKRPYYQNYLDQFASFLISCCLKSFIIQISKARTLSHSF